MLCHPQITTNMPFNSYIALRFGSTHFHMVNHGNYLRITAKEDLKPTKSCEFQWSWRDSGSGERCTEAWFKGNKEHNENSPNMKSEKNRNPTKGKSIYTAWAATFWKLPWFKKPEKCENMATPGCFAPFAAGGFGCPKTWKDWIAGQNKPRGIDVIQYIQESLWVMQFVTGDNQGGPLLRDQCGECPIDICFSGSSCLGFTGTTWDGPIRIYTKKLSVSCCELLTRITIEVDIPPEDVLTTRNHNVEQDVETFGILFFSHQFYPLSWAENRSPHEVLQSTWSGLCSRVSRMQRGGDSLCHSQCAGDVTGRSLSVCSATLLWGVAGIADIARKSFSLPHFFPHKFHVVLCVDLSFFLELCHHVLDDMMYIIYLESIDLWWSQTY